MKAYKLEYRCELGGDTEAKPKEKIEERKDSRRVHPPLAAKRETTSPRRETR